VRRVLVRAVRVLAPVAPPVPAAPPVPPAAPPHPHTTTTAAHYHTHTDTETETGQGTPVQEDCFPNRYIYRDPMYSYRASCGVMASALVCVGV
jgi:hypothetical protein